MSSGDSFNLIADRFSVNSVDEVGVENCELSLDDGFNFEDVCRKSVLLALFLRDFEIKEFNLPRFVKLF